MSLFPGGFPGLYDSDTGMSSSQQDEVSTQSRSSRFKKATPELDAVKKSLKNRKKVFKKNMVHNMDCTTYVFIFITYLYDCSLLLLIMRSFVQSVCNFISITSGESNTNF